MQFIKPDVSTMCIGQAASMGSLLLAGGTKGKRYCLPHSRIMIHQPSGGFQGQASDIDIHAREILKIRERLNEIMAKHTGQTVERVERDMERDNFMEAEAAVEYGLVDNVLAKRPDIAPKAELALIHDVIGFTANCETPALQSPGTSAIRPRNRTSGTRDSHYER